MAVDPRAVAEKRRAMLARLQPVHDKHWQSVEESWAKERAGGNVAVKERLAENVITARHGFDLFVTPNHLAERMVEIAEIKPGMTVLEPEAGTGRIAKAIRNAGVEPVCVEYAWDTYEFLRKQGYNVTQSDFLEWTAPHKFDVILMNPPFSNSADIIHVMWAYMHLARKGILVAIMSEGAFHGDRKKVANFRAWAEMKGAHSEQLDAQTFKESGTNVNARLFTLRRKI